MEQQARVPQKVPTSWTLKIIKQIYSLRCNVFCFLFVFFFFKGKVHAWPYPNKTKKMGEEREVCVFWTDWLSWSLVAGVFKSYEHSWCPFSPCPLILLLTCLGYQKFGVLSARLYFDRTQLYIISWLKEPVKRGLLLGGCVNTQAAVTHTKRFPFRWIPSTGKLEWLVLN